VCPLDHKYCCGEEANGEVLCGNDPTCSGPIKDSAAAAGFDGKVGLWNGMCAAVMAIAAAIL
jgi:hypothetical protein